MASATFQPLVFFVKMVLMVVLLCVDAFWNSSNEYDDYGTNVQLAFGGEPQSVELLLPFERPVLEDGGPRTVAEIILRHMLKYILKA